MKRKVCSKCNMRKSLSLFSKSKSGVKSYCLDCDALRAKESRAKRKKQGIVYEAPDLPDEIMPTNELLNYRKKKFKHMAKAKEAKALVKIPIKVDGPIALALVGDPHWDDDGCDLEAWERDAKIINDTDHMLAGSVGDYRNNWVGRLAAQYAHQATTAEEAIKILEHCINMVDWLFLVAGNHDVWSDADDPLPWLAAQGEIYEHHGVRLELVFPNRRQVRLNFRHDFRGSSQWNPVHGLMKAAKISGYRDHVWCAGHRHISGYGIVIDPITAQISHCIAVAGYKVHDGYATRLGLSPHRVCGTSAIVIDPDAEEGGLVQHSHPTLRFSRLQRVI